VVFSVGKYRAGANRHVLRCECVGRIENAESFLGGKMNKPSWEDAPAWAMFLVQDLYGRWAWCENEPFVAYGHWCNPTGAVMFHLNRDWDKSLEPRPTPEGGTHAG
jgi:hypothetical protein